MNEKHFIIMYGVISYCGKMIKCQKDIDFILADTELEVGSNFKNIKEPFINFSNNNTSDLKHLYRNHHTLAATMAKINTFQIPE